MDAYEILVIPDAWAFEQTIILNDEEFDFYLRLNERDNEGRGAWYLDISQGAVEIATGLKVVAGYNLLRGVVHIDRPKGKLYVYDKDAQSPFGRDPDADNFGDRVVLFYEPA